MRLVSLAITALLPMSARAQLPEPVLPQGVGVNIHFVTGHERDLDMIAAAGFKFIAWTSAGKPPRRRAANTTGPAMTNSLPTWRSAAFARSTYWTTQTAV